MNNKPSMSKRAIRMATGLALVAVMAVIAVSLLLTGVGGATAFNAGGSDSVAGHMPIPAQYTEQCSNGIAVPNPADNAGLVADCAALLASKDTLEGTTGNIDWSANVHINRWRGVTTANNRVVRLVLSTVSTLSSDLNGAIPAELGNLTNLTHFYILSNLNGAIPAELGNLANLRKLWLNGNQLTGEIPAELGKLEDLTELHIQSNRLTGEIPAELGKLRDLMELDLAYNRLTGEIPAELGNLRNLRELYLSNNQLTGEIPAELGNLRDLWPGRLTLYYNQFTGCIPSSLRVPLGNGQINVIGLPICGAATATPTATATSAPRATATPTPTATSVPGGRATPVATPTPTATSAASNDVMGRLAALEGQVAEIPDLRRQVAEIPDLRRQVAVLATKVARLEGNSGQGAATVTPTPTATPASVVEASATPTATPSATPTSVAGTSGGDACVERLAGSGSVNGRWTPGCLTANSSDNRTYYARFYTFTLYAASEVTVTLSSTDATPYLFLLEGEGTGGAVTREKGVANATSVAITAALQPGAYTIEASTWEAETGGDFTLELEVAR